MKSPPSHVLARIVRTRASKLLDLFKTQYHIDSIPHARKSETVISKEIDFLCIVRDSSQDEACRLDVVEMIDRIYSDRFDRETLKTLAEIRANAAKKAHDQAKANQQSSNDNEKFYGTI